MLITPTALRSLYTGFSTAYQGGFAGVTPQYGRVATTVPSTTKANEYGWLGEMPRIREWIGDRVINNIGTHGYSIKNRKFESTIAVDVDDVDDDNLGIYTPLFTEFGRSAASFPDELVFALLAAGFASACYDGQYFFDTDHPVLAADGVTMTSVANTDGGAGTAWYLLDVSRALKPIIFQNRKAFDLVRMDAAVDEMRFSEDKIRYGLSGRCNVGFGFWQMAWGSKQTLDATHYEAARVGLASMKGDGGRPLGLAGNLLVVPPSLEGAGRKLLTNAMTTGGETNQWQGTAELLVVPWLA